MSSLNKNTLNAFLYPIILGRSKLKQNFKEVKITYHSKKSWGRDGVFKSVGRGQEFVMEENNTVEKWV